MRRVIAITGKRLAGKDTLAGCLREAGSSQGIPLERHAFAAESKRQFVAAMRELGITVDGERLLHDREYKELWRPELTRFTVESLERDRFVFCRVVADRIAASAAVALISDLRLRLELEYLRARLQVRVVRVVRSDAQRAASGWSHVAAVDEHFTETELDDPELWDEVVPNDGTLDELREHAVAILGRALG